MKSTIVSQEKNEFLEREEFVIEITNEGSPTKEAIISDLGKNAELTVVRRIAHNFGKNSFVADVIVYNSVEAKDKNMVIPQKVRKKMEEERKAKEEEERKKKEEEAKAAAEAEAKAKEEAQAAQTEEVKEEAQEETIEESTEETAEAEEKKE
jgi:ribosomal protein S24E